MIFSCSILQANIDVDLTDVGSEHLGGAEKFTPFFISLNGDAIGKAKFRDSDFNEHLRYTEVEGIANGIFYYNPECDEGLYGGVGFNVTSLDWHDNIFFRQKRFDTVIVKIGGFSERLCGWLWNGFLAANIDVDHCDLGSYTTYDALLWGRYAYVENVGVHVGLIAETGMRVDHVYPILGLDWTINRSWVLNLVFPVDISAVYLVNDNWSVALAGRVFDSRHRVGKREPLSEGIYTYRNYGTELLVSYEVDCWIEANLHAGYTFGGTLKVANRHYRDSHRLHFGGAPYFGGEFEIKF